MDIQKRCIESYERLKNLKLVGQETGIPWQSVYVYLRNAGIAVTGDKAKYGSDKDKLAAKGEALFLKFVPFAKDTNQKLYQAKIDFDVLGYGVDVKTSRPKLPNKNSKSKCWSFCVKKQEVIADFFVCLAFSDDVDLVAALLIPGECARRYSTINLTPTGKWIDYKISPSDLSSFFEALPKRI